MNFTSSTSPQTLSDSDLAAAFPSDFVWGTATASYQIEGAAREDGRAPSIWDTFSAAPGNVLNGDTGAIAADHYHRMADDVELMARLGMGAYRFSLAWPRILPHGRVNERGLDFYDRLVDALLAKGIQPFVTLYHWDLPQDLQDKGGWLNRDTAYAFADYAEVAARRLGDRVTAWITHNEPWCSSYLGYGVGVHAPGLHDRQAAITAGHHLLLSHGLAVPRLRSHVGGADVGITLNFTPCYPADDSPETARDVDLCDAFGNRWLADPLFLGRYPEHLFANLGLNEPPIQHDDLAIISTPIDFLGVNNYSRNLVKGQPTQPLADQCQLVSPVPGSCYTNMSWEIYPQGLADLLLRLHRDYAPGTLYVTENGASFTDHWNGERVVSDPQRVDYLRRYIRSISQVLSEGVPLKGYFVWSLMDNFEWAMGYSQRFGIVYVDYANQQRIIKESGHWYSNLARKNT